MNTNCVALFFLAPARRSARRRLAFHGRFDRSFRLPDAVDRERISAKFENGLLTITLPKSEKAQQRARRIEIGRK